MDLSFNEAVKLASKGQRRRDRALDKGILNIFGGGFVLYVMLQLAANGDRVMNFELSSTVGRHFFPPSSPQWEAFNGWHWDANINPSDATVIVTAAILFVASFNVAAVASAVDHQSKFSTVLMQHWWSIGAGASTVVAAQTAFAVAFTRFPGEPGLGAALIFLSLLTGAGSWLVAGENSVAASRLVSVASKKRKWEESKDALGRALWQRTPAPLIEKLSTGPKPMALHRHLLPSAALVFAVVLIEALGQTAWTVLILDQWATADDAAGDWSVYGFWVILDCFGTAAPSLMLVTILILGWIAQARRKSYTKLIFIAGFIFLGLMTVSGSSSYGGFVGPMERGWSSATIALIGGLVLLGALKGRGPGAPIPLAILAWLAKDELRNRKAYKVSRKKYLAWAAKRKSRQEHTTAHEPTGSRSVEIWNVNITSATPSSNGHNPQRITTYQRAARQFFGKLLP